MTLSFVPKRVPTLMRNLSFASPRSAAGMTAVLLVGLAIVMRLSLPPDVALLGLLVGLTYTVLAVAISLTYRIGGVVNLALASTALLGVVVHRAALAYALPWYTGLLLGLVIALAVGALTEIVLVRRLMAAPRAVVVMATAALAVALLPVVDRTRRLRDPGVVPTDDSPPGLPQIRFGDYLVTSSTVLLLILLPLVAGSLLLVLTKTQLGVRVQASANDRTLARLGGIPAGRYVLAAWAFAAMLACLVITIGPFSSQGSGHDTQFTMLGVSDSLAPVLGQLVWPAVIAAIARCSDIPAMAITGMSLAMLEQALIWNGADLGLLGAAVICCLVLSALLQPPTGLRTERPGTWMAFRVGDRWPAEVRDLRWARGLRATLPVLGILAFLAVALRASPHSTANLASWVGVAVVALAVFVETGLAGSLTMAHVPIAAAGAAAYVMVTASSGGPGLGVLVAILVGVVLGSAVALVDLRAGALLTLSLTLVLALTTSRWYTVVSTSQSVPGVPVIGGVPLSGDQMLAVVGILGLGTLVLLRNLVRSTAGQSLVAHRDNGLLVEAWGYTAERLRVGAGAIAGGLAGLGGCLIIANQSSNDPRLFSVSIAVALLFACVLGGLTSPGGVVLGSVCVFAIPMLLPRSGLDLGVGLAGFVLVLLAPTGLISLYARGRDTTLLALHRRLKGQPSVGPRPITDAGLNGVGVEPGDARARRAPVEFADGRAMPRRAAGDVVLEASGLTRSFGGVRAVQGVDLSLRQGEIVTLIGSNGAGKTTTFDMLSGFLEPDSGTVRLFGHDVTGERPAHLSRLGLVRTFQDAALFPTLPLEQVLGLAVAERLRMPVLAGLCGVDRGRRDREVRVCSALRRFGLEKFAETRVGELSTGTRRIAELAAASLLGARVLLLDEPSAGIAQREVEGLGAVLRRFRDEEGVSLLVIEHDIPLCIQISDRTVALAGGAVVASGPSREVVADPLVIASYMGTDPLAVQRSGALVTNGGTPLRPGASPITRGAGDLPGTPGLINHQTTNSEEP